MGFYIECHYMCMVYLVFIFLFLGVCRFFIAFATDLKSRLTILENEIQHYTNGQMNASKSRKASQKIIHNFVEFHAHVKQLSHLWTLVISFFPQVDSVFDLQSNFLWYFRTKFRLAADWDMVYRPLLVVFFYFGGILWCMALYDMHSVSCVEPLELDFWREREVNLCTFCCLLFVHFQFVTNNNFLLLEAAVIAFSAVMPFLFAVCYVGGMVTNVYLDLKESIYDISWFMCPLHMKNYILMMLILADKPIVFESFGSLNCSNDTFNKVAFGDIFDSQAFWENDERK